MDGWLSTWTSLVVHEYAGRVDCCCCLRSGSCLRALSGRCLRSGSCLGEPVARCLCSGICLGAPADRCLCSVRCLGNRSSRIAALRLLRVLMYLYYCYCCISFARRSCSWDAVPRMHALSYSMSVSCGWNFACSHTIRQTVLFRY